MPIDELVSIVLFICATFPSLIKLAIAGFLISISLAATRPPFFLGNNLCEITAVKTPDNCDQI
jgi:hypothetical protein